MTTIPSYDVFAGAVASRFRSTAAGGSADETIELSLVEVSARLVAHGMENFSLTFHGPADLGFEQGTVEFQHDAIDPFELFIVPISADPQRVAYEAILYRATVTSQEDQWANHS